MIDTRGNNIWKVYVYTNKINNKMYIGQTRTSLEKRAGKNGIHYKKCKAFHRAIKKYGFDMFDKEIVADNLTKQEADDFEILLIDKLQTKNIKYGYNIADGGNFGYVPPSFDLSNQKIGRWKVLYLIENYEYSERYWMCQCDCGTIKPVRQSHLISGDSLSCGCITQETRYNRFKPSNYIIFDDYVEIEAMNDGSKFKVDLADFEKVKGIRWRKANRYFIGEEKYNSKQEIMLLRLLFDNTLKPNIYNQIKHINGDDTDFRKSNLTTEPPNGVSKEDYWLQLTIGYEYISYDKTNQRWVLSKGFYGRKHTFKTLNEAKIYKDSIIN